MTTTFSVGSSGRTYTTIQAAWNALPATFVDDYVFELYNDSTFTTGTVLSGKTVGSFTLTIKCAAGHSFCDHASKLTNPLRPEQSHGVLINYPGGNVIEIGVNNVIVDGLQINSVANCVYQSASGANVLIRNCVAQTSVTSTSSGPYKMIDGTVVNSVAICTASGVGGMSDGGSAKFYNVTAVQIGGGGSFGFRGNYDTPVCNNCVSMGFGTAFRSGVTGNYNASDQASPPGANSVASLTFANQFENVAGAGTMDFRVKAGSGLVAGTRDATNTADLDIVKSARSTTTPTIGAWEYVTAGSGSTITSANGVATVSATARSNAAAALTPAAGVATVSVVGSGAGSIDLSGTNDIFAALNQVVHASKDVTFWLHDATTGELLATIETTTDSNGRVGHLYDEAIETGVTYRLDYEFDTGEYGVVKRASES